MPLQAAFGDRLKLVGNHEATGSWDLDDAPDMEWNGESLGPSLTFCLRRPLLQYSSIYKQAAGGMANRASSAQAACLWHFESLQIQGRMSLLIKLALTLQKQHLPSSSQPSFDTGVPANMMHLATPG